VDTARGSGAFKPFLYVYAALCIFGAGLHVWWHWLMPTLPQMSGLTEHQWQLFNVFNWSIALVCLTFSIVALWLGRSTSFSLSQVRGLVGIMFAFWLGRFVLELVFPVRVPLLGEYTSLVIKVLLTVGLCILALPEILVRFGCVDREGQRAGDSFGNAVSVYQVL
jgi:hypothetical protein